MITTSSAGTTSNSAAITTGSTTTIGTLSFCNTHNAWGCSCCYPSLYPYPYYYYTTPEVTKAEFESLRDEVADLKKIVKKNRKLDKYESKFKNGTIDKIEYIRKVAKLIDLDLDEVFGNS